MIELVLVLTIAVILLAGRLAIVNQSMFSTLLFFLG